MNHLEPDKLKVAVYGLHSGLSVQRASRYDSHEKCHICTK